jgi:hypothetical protein
MEREQQGLYLSAEEATLELPAIELTLDRVNERDLCNRYKTTASIAPGIHTYLK